MFPFQMFQLSIPDSMFPVQVPPMSRATAHQPLGICHRLAELLGLMAIKYAQDVKVAIADMTKDRPWEGNIFEIFLRHRYAGRQDARWEHKRRWSRSSHLEPAPKMRNTHRGAPSKEHPVQLDSFSIRSQDP